MRTLARLSVVQDMVETHEQAAGGGTPALKRVLNVGAGTQSRRGSHPMFARGWKELRLDIDASTNPDIQGSVIDMRGVVAEQSVDAIFASHIMEHLYDHEVVRALMEFRRVLTPTGFMLITSPDVETVASLVLQHGLDYVVYQSPAGPITTGDMLYGHGRSIRNGNEFMAHKTGFTCTRLGNVLIDCGFPIVLTKRGEHHDLWAVALMEEADQEAIQQALHGGGLNMF